MFNRKRTVHARSDEWIHVKRSPRKSSGDLFSNLPPLVLLILFILAAFIIYYIVIAIIYIAICAAILAGAYYLTATGWKAWRADETSKSDAVAKKVWASIAISVGINLLFHVMIRNAQTNVTHHETGHLWWKRSWDETQTNWTSITLMHIGLLIALLLPAYSVSSSVCRYLKAKKETSERNQSAIQL